MLPMISTERTKVIAVGVCLVLSAVPANASDNCALGKVIQKIEQTHNAKTYEVENSGYKDRTLYEIGTLRNGEFYESFVDPQSGEMLSDEKEETLFWTPLGDDQKQAFLQTKISLWQAIEAVCEQKNYPIEEVNFQVNSNNTYFEVIFGDGEKYLIDGVSGRFVKELI